MTSKLILLSSPPASGKTYWVSSYCKELNDCKVLVMSPLRALADECRNIWSENITIMTPEEWLSKKCFFDIVIYDEFHLFFYWGDTFRPLMWEVFYELSLTAKYSFLLTATISPEMQKNISLFETHFDEMIWIDHGNQQLKFKPSSYIKAPDRKWIIDEIYHQKKNDSVKLIFCKYRGEVFELERDLLNKGYSCIACVGGESRYMSDRLKQNPRPDFIISTTVLSHGVNLPGINKIFFLYKTENLDFWIQMVARGGRRGEKYQVFALERPEGIDWNPLQNLVHVLWHKFRRKKTHKLDVFLG